MKTPAIQLQFPTKPEAEAAVETLNFVQRALNVENDLFIRESTRLVMDPALPAEGALYTVVARFGVRPAIDPAHPMRLALAPSTLESQSYGVAYTAIPHLMIDLETFGTRPGCQVRSLGAVFFSPGGLGQTFYANFRTDLQAERCLHQDPDTVAWWARQGEDVRLALEENQEAPEMALARFRDWIGARATFKEVRIWGNGANFDEPILGELYRVYGIEQPWRYSGSRCFRTLRALSGVKAPAVPARPHHALDDAVAQAQHAIAILNHTGGWATA